MEPRYRLVFAGRLVPGVNPDQVIPALAERFQVRAFTARQMIRGGGRHVLKRDLDLDRAQRYRGILEGIGLETDLEPEDLVGAVDSALALEPSIQAPSGVVVQSGEPARSSREPPSPDPLPGSTPCPKCGAVAVSPVTGVCDACGVVAERYLARLAAEGTQGGTSGRPSDSSPPDQGAQTGPEGNGDAESVASWWDPCGVAAGRGWGWVGDAWSQLRGQPWAWVGALVLFMLVSAVLGVVPVVGGLALGILGPMLTGGLMLGAHAQWGGGRFEIAHLFAGFSRNPGGLALVGVASVGLSLLLGLIIVLVVFIGLSVLAPDLSTLQPDSGVVGLDEMGPLASPLMLALLLLSLVLGVPLMMAILFAPALVAIDSVPAGRALWLSLLGCGRNLLPLLVFSLVALGLGIATLLTFGLALLLAMPLLTLALFHAYRDIYRC